MRPCISAWPHLFIAGKMSVMRKIFLLITLVLLVQACQKQVMKPAQGKSTFQFRGLTIDTVTTGPYYGVSLQPAIGVRFSAPVSRSSALQNLQLRSVPGTIISSQQTYARGDSEVILQPSSALIPITGYNIYLGSDLVSRAGDTISNSLQTTEFITTIDTSDKYPRISDSSLLTLVEQQTFRYFYDFGHPVSGMARERSTSGDIVTTGGSGFGVMALLVGIQRNFISRAEGMARITEIVSFLTNDAHRYHGAFPHWMNGTTGATIPFSTQDDGADLVETSYMMEGLLCARQFFNSATDAGEISLRNSINGLWNAVDWSWFRQGNQNTLYWHWSPDFGWASNQQVNGWNEALITYVLAASANNDSIPRAVYDNGWAKNGAIRNGNTYYGVTLPLGTALGGPLFFTHYSFLGMNPLGLSDAYANYWTQDTAHAQINYRYCVANPGHYNGYGPDCWGLTASDDNFSGYSAHSPTNDLGVISPTAAVSSLPYTPIQSMNAIRFFYYKLGDKIWSSYGFTDAFNLTQIWFDNQYLAIDEGPEIVMIENYRSGLLWNLFMSCPEVQRGLKQLGFQAP
jgi:hypothetical protein